MIDELQVSNLALIHEAELAFAPGLSVITGETGAGKTALLSALKLLAGERGEASMLREGAECLQVQGRLFLPGDAGEGLVASRSISADGRSRVRINGSLSSVSALAQQAGGSIDLCGQHEHQRLLKPASHLAMLDAWIGEGLMESLAAYGEAFEAAQAARLEVERIQAARQLSEEQVQQSRYILGRIDEVNPLPGEYQQLCEDVPKAENAELLARGLEGARSALSGDGGVLDSLGSALSLLDSVAALDDGLAQAALCLRDASYIIEDVAMDVRRYAESVDYAQSDLEQMQDRMAALQGLMRNWGPGMEQVFAARDEAARTLAAVDSFDVQMQRAEKRLQRAEEHLGECAQALHAKRAAAAPGFAQAVSAQMERLQMQGASLQCQLELAPRSAWTAGGPSKLEFLFKPGAKLSARPLAKIASGGEISRVMLAIKVVLGQSDAVDTLVFDEVDAGVGGTAAQALAEVLADLAQSHQVIVVTHLAQVAVLGQRHYLASKSAGESPQTSFTQIEGRDRVAEIARMLSGSETKESLAHAEVLLQQAGVLGKKA